MKQVYGQSVTAVIRRLGKEGIPFRVARAGLRQLGVKPSDNTIRVFLSAGKKGQRGAPARINRDNVRELRRLGREAIAV